jgi:hypothetical protein
LSRIRFPKLIGNFLKVIFPVYRIPEIDEVHFVQNPLIIRQYLKKFIFYGLHNKTVFYKVKVSSVLLQKSEIIKNSGKIRVESKVRI